MENEHLSPNVLPINSSTSDQHPELTATVNGLASYESEPHESLTILREEAIKQPLLFHCPPYGSHLEARGWAFDAIGRSISFVGNAVFVGTAVIHLARINAGCDPEDSECSARTQYGIRPSSLLSLYNVIVGVLSSALLPLLGAIVDHTNQRLLIARISAVVYCASLFPMIFVSYLNWFIVCVLLIFSALVGWIHTGMAFAYLPEMSENNKVLEALNTSFAVVQFGTDVVFILLVVGIIASMNQIDNSVFTAQVAQSISFIVTTVVWGYAWCKLLGNRPAMSELPQGSHLLSVGFRKLYRTSISIWNNHRPLGIFYMALAFSESATQALVVIGTTYSIEILNFSSIQTGITFFILLVFSAFGCYMSPLSLRFTNPIRSDQLCLTFFGLFTICVAAFVTSANQIILFYILASFWGVCGGWKYTIERYLVCTIIPKGQDTELMGMYLFAGQMLSWLPTLIFTVMNEAGVSIRISMVSPVLFWLGAILFLQCMGPYRTAVRNADDTTQVSRLCPETVSNEVKCCSLNTNRDSSI